VAAYPASGATVDELFQSADVTMYQAKEAGRNLVRLHPGLNPLVSPTGLEPALERF
jgi:predicted signal transduction protein with EAL and GGDEF domain